MIKLYINRYMSTHIILKNEILGDFEFESYAPWKGYSFRGNAGIRKIAAPSFSICDTRRVPIAVGSIVR